MGTVSCNPIILFSHLLLRNLMKVVSLEAWCKTKCAGILIHRQLKGEMMIGISQISLHPLPNSGKNLDNNQLKGLLALLLHNRKILSLLCRDVLRDKGKYLLVKAMSMVNHNILHNNSETLKVNKLGEDLLEIHLVALVCLKHIRMSKFLYLALPLQGLVKMLTILNHK